jgi:N,N-dimethylformamidase beta subunit-like, C-terminal
MASPPVRAAFAAIVLATIAAFFVTQQLKGESPLVLRFAANPDAISPNGDGVRDGSSVGFDLSRKARLSFLVIDSEGRDVRRFLNERRLPGDSKHRYFWDGRDNQGRRVPDGTYRLQVVDRDEGRVINSIKSILVDTKPPRVRLLSARPGVIAPGDPGQHPQVVIRYAGPRNQAPEFRIFRTDEGAPRVVARFRGDNRREAVWRGSIRGHPATDGDYAFTVTVRDKAGNRAVAPAAIPTARIAGPGTGVAVRHLTLQGPVTVVPAGALVRFAAGPYSRRFRFSLSRLGSRRPVGSGKRVGGPFRVRIPRRSRTGLYFVSATAGGRTASWPLAVEGRASGGRRRPLVVLPVMTWQGLNPVDDDLDGFADTLETSRSVRLGRPFARGRTPPRLDSETLPLLRFLDRARLPYDLTTDVSLARGGSVTGVPGVVLAGSARWLPTTLSNRLRRYVEDGGSIALLGADSLRRSVQLSGSTLRAPTAARPENALGERTELIRAPPAPLSVEVDRLGIFGSRFVGEFSLFDLSRALPPGTTRLAAAGRDAGKPAFTAYRLGRGVVVRVGTPQWSGDLSDPRVAEATKRIWSLLRRS